jgi:hypothetical protein
MLAKLEAKGIVLEAFEPGNEINWAGFNADFSLPGEGRALGADDLKNDPEGKRVAKGFLQYIKLLEALKEIRDHSKLNQHTPIITTGPADIGGSTWPRKEERMPWISRPRSTFFALMGSTSWWMDTAFTAILRQVIQERAQALQNGAHTSKKMA